MLQNTRLEIICAEAQRFSDPTPEPNGELKYLRSAAATFATALSEVAGRGSSRVLATRWKALSIALVSVLRQIKRNREGLLSEDARWLQENVPLLYAALDETGELRTATKKIPEVRMSKYSPVPRILAVAEHYLATVHYHFDRQTFAEYLGAFQGTTTLQVQEVWGVVLCLKLVLLEETAARAWRVLRRPDTNYGVADCIRSLHHVGQTPWKEVLEPLLVIDGILREDPAGAYALMDFESREQYWSAISSIAGRSDHSETEVANEALALAQQASERFQEDSNPRLKTRKAHVGYYLVAEGATVLKQKLGFRPGLRQKTVSLLLSHPNTFYLTSVCLVTLAVISAVLLGVYKEPMTLDALLLAIFALLIPSSQSAVELVNALITSVLPAHSLPKLDFSERIPDGCATVIAVPALLLNELQVRQLVEDLEVRYLGNRDHNLHFALLTDLPDSRESANEDDPLVRLCADLIAKLNEKYDAQDRGTFLLLHRHRVYNQREGVWMGWERKRGKLMDFYGLLRGRYDAFPVKVGDLSLLRRISFVITLDADTELPRGAGQRMIGTLAHPLNQAIIDPRRNTVVAGYGILQPRVSVSIHSAARSRLSNIFSGQTGLDIYTRAVSDLYQDLYGEGIFTGKGICEVDALLQVLERRFPDNALLSHDLIEGAYARAGLVSDVEVIDDYPSHYSAYNRRKHRWMRGDWQITEWLLPCVPDASGKRVPNPISLVSRWKILDNLRRSLLEPATFLLLALAWLVLPGSALRWTAAAVLLMFSPAWFQCIFTLIRAAWKRSLAIARDALSAVMVGNFMALLRLTFLAHQTLLALDAIMRVMVRRLVTRRGLLEWETAAQAESGSSRTLVDRYLDWTPAVTIGFGLLLWLEKSVAISAAVPILLLWAASKLISMWLNQAPRGNGYQMSQADRLLLRRSALRTWRYFAEWSNEEHHWLIPDNVQEEPYRVAARTSPTNLALLLNARQVACEMGYLTVPEFAELTSRTLASIEALPRFRGHLFNWYDTRSLKPLPQRFVSSVDSGNLVAALWSLQEGALERLQRPLLDFCLLEGLIDHLREVSSTALPSSNLRCVESTDWLQRMRRLMDSVSSNEEAVGHDPEIRWFSEQARVRNESVTRIVLLHCPWLLPEFGSLRETLALNTCQECPLERLPEFIDAASKSLSQARTSAAPEQQPLYRSLEALLGEARQNTGRLVHELRNISSWAGQLADDMDFRFLFNRWRKLLSVGFDVESQQLHSACYDLLASEARLAAFVAVSKEDVPQDAWFLMGRPHVRQGDRPVLLSWTGTAFEYLMPSLWLRTYPNTLLERSRAEAVRSQQTYAARKRVPWGISESAYAKRDEVGNYQYRAFGLPALALHKDDNEGLVISPYSTFLALSVDPVSCMRNLRRMCKEGWLGAYGFYEAADYTSAERSGLRHHYELVRCWMAHHQGMSLIAIANLLYGDVVHRWFHNNLHVQATELLLQEKPVITPIGLNAHSERSRQRKRAVRYRKV
jgi:hypothetical protein